MTLSHTHTHQQSAHNPTGTTNPRNTANGYNGKVHNWRFAFACVRVS